MNEFTKGETLSWSDAEMGDDVLEVEYLCPAVIPGFHLVIFGGTKVMIHGDNLSKAKPVEIELEDESC